MANIPQKSGGNRLNSPFASPYLKHWAMNKHIFNSELFKSPFCRRTLEVFQKYSTPFHRITNFKIRKIYSDFSLNEGSTKHSWTGICLISSEEFIYTATKACKEEGKVKDLRSEGGSSFIKVGVLNTEIQDSNSQFGLQNEFALCNPKD